jgi:hypothetical protein
VKRLCGQGASNILIVALSLLGALLSPVPGAGSTSFQETTASKITFTILDCTVSVHGLRPQIQVRDISIGRGRAWMVVPESVKSTDSRTIMTFQLPSGSYTVVVTQGPCGDIFDMTVRRGFDRSLVVTPLSGIFLDYHNHNSLTGTLPFPGLSADLLICTSSPCNLATLSGFNNTPVTIDQGAYYVNQLPASEWYVRLHFADTCSVIIRVDGSNVPGMKYGHFERDITAADLTTAEGDAAARKCWTAP